MTIDDVGLRRYAADLPPVSHFVTLGEGDTPLLHLGRMAAELGLRRLSAKVESANPTGSYKDRVAAMSISLAVDRGQHGWIATSSGNAGVSMAAYGRRAGLPGFLCMVSTAPPEKRLPLVPYGIELVAVDGVGDGSLGSTGETLMRRVRDAAQRHSLFLAITANAFNPDGMRGIDTIGYELAEQVPEATHVYVPSGGGGLLTSLARGLRHRAVPARVIACQPAGCAPLVRFLDGEINTPAIEQCESQISALQLPKPPDGPAAVAATAGSGGWGTSVTDDEILTAQRRLARSEGLFAEPAGAAGLAALIADVRSGRVGRDDHPVIVLTGAGWKDLGRFGAAADRIPVVSVDDVSQRVDTWVAENRHRPTFPLDTEVTNA